MNIIQHLFRPPVSYLTRYLFPSIKILDSAVYELQHQCLCVSVFLHFHPLLDIDTGRLREHTHTQSKEVIFFSSYTQDVGCWQRSAAGSIPHIESSRWYIGSIHPPHPPKSPTALPDAIPALIFSNQSQCDPPHCWPSMLLASPVCHLVPTLSRIHSLSALGFSTVSSILPSIASRVNALHKCIVTHIVQLGSQRTQRSMFSTIHGINQQLENLFLFTRCCCCLFH